LDEYRNANHADDLRLIKRIQRNGDRAAADELIRQYYDAIHGFVRKQIRNPDFALDLTQEIFISCLRTITHYDPKKDASFKTWLYKIASNKLIDCYRSRAFKVTVKTLSIDDAEPVSEADFTLKFEDSDFTERVCSYVGTLPPETQKIFTLHIFGEHTFAEIAETVGLPEGSVKSKYYRLINLLRKEFANYE
jgi:RNA polymerase sigma-70 factor (ECF subfamily)